MYYEKNVSFFPKYMWDIFSSEMACISYVDQYSAGHDSYNDLRIGYNNNIVACNSGHIRACHPGDLIIVRSRLCFYIGKIVKKSEAVFSHWKKAGGRLWAMNYHCIPMTDIHYISDVDIESKHKLFNSRFCTLKLKNLIRGLMMSVGICEVDDKYDGLLRVMDYDADHERRWILYRVYIYKV